MAQIAKIEAKAETKCDADKMYNFFKCNMTQFSNMLPHIIKSAQVIEGEAGHVGNIMLFQYVLGNTMTVKIRTEDIKDGERSITMRAIEGEIMQLYSSFVAKLNVNEGSAHWLFEFEKNDESAPNPENYAKLAVKMTKGLDLYLLNH